jgi:predicted transposase YdaD
VPVWSVIVLLRPAADGPELTGVVEKSFPGRGQTLVFRYEVIRIWLEPPEKLLTAGLAVLPLAPVSNVAPEQLEAVLTTVAERLKREAEPAAQKVLWTATMLFIGLRHRREQVQSMVERVGDMILGMRGLEESWVYQDILAKGEAKGEAKGALDEARNTLLRLGRKKLGEPDERVLGLLVAVGDLDRLHLMLDALLEAARWEDLFAQLRD